MVMTMTMLMAGTAECSLKAMSACVSTLTTIVYPVGFIMSLFYRRGKLGFEATSLVSKGHTLKCGSAGGETQG